ncbi:ABC transporter substrate-binding protein [Pseudonocardia sp. NPDC049154]|uniref:ABC transporter substrate-binding protein n=1 Tax=Pseudonocardia sp. NPDC049154 TaxID=3155501 RepID=UPI003401F34E
MRTIDRSRRGRDGAGRPGLLGRIGAFAAGILALSLVAACSSGDAGNEQSTVGVGISGAVSDAPFYLADQLGYFAQENVKVELSNFASASDMIAPLGTGDLQVGASGATAALYNAIERGVKVRIVADKGRIQDTASYMGVLVAKPVYDSGQVTSLADLRGRLVADYAESSSTSAYLNAGLSGAGLSLADVNRTYLTGSQHMAALENGSVAASVTVEPFVTAAVNSGAAVRLPESDRMYPEQQTSVVLYGERFATEEPEVADRFMRAYLRGVRAFNDAIGPDGKLSGPTAPQVIDVLAERTQTPKETLQAIVVNGVDPSGAPNEESLQKDLDFFRQGGWLTDAGMSLQDSLDLSFVQRAAQGLGPYTKS